MSQLPSDLDATSRHLLPTPPPLSQALRVQSFGLTDPGKVRPRNEDRS